ncbi:BTB and MATH domain-containing protein 38-like [Haliotis rufescens]|uniref:BTB and MATH domain-containing protein 38-like n=1 Tax=Haliotis rufescens TaxID=6454 RepID=UPI00201E853F|nr:BTB and MATH domain-containing protein 38-like [Haliotis rufescens]
MFIIRTMSNPESSTAAAGAQPSVATAAGVSKEEKPATPGLDDSMFSTPSALTDVALVVDGKKLHVSKALLCLASPAFLKMFEGDFKDKTEVPIADKKYADFVEFLLCVHPSTCKPVQRETLDVVLPLADEYEVESLKQRCEQFVLTRFLLKDEQQNNPANEELVHFTYLADKYKLKTLLDKCVVRLKCRTYDGGHGVKRLPEFQRLSPDAKVWVMSERLRLMEKPVAEILDAAIREPCKRNLDNIENAHCNGCLGAVKHSTKCPVKCKRELYTQWESIYDLKQIFKFDSRFK